MDLIFWTLIIGIILLAITTILIIFLITKNPDFVSRIVLIMFIFIIGLSGITSLASFLIISIIRSFFDIGSELLFSIGNLMTFIGTMLGLGISLKFYKRKKEECKLDPQCELI